MLCALELSGNLWLLQEQVTNMTNKWHIYMTFDGRISMAGLSANRCGYLAEAMIDSYKNC